MTAEAVIDALERLSSRLAWTQPDANAWWSAYRESRKTAAAPTAAQAA
jgi:hypothetical protein